jgi:hypothetical protein
MFKTRHPRRSQTINVCERRKSLMGVINFKVDAVKP